MRIVVAGAHGQVARRLGRLLSARGDTVVGIVRNPAHEADVRDDGVEPAVLDLESASVDDVASVVDTADAVVFSAGAGPGSGLPRPPDDGAAARRLHRRPRHLERHVERGSIPRDDVAAVLVALLDADGDGTVLELVGGTTPIDEAVAAAVRRGGRG